MKIFLTMVLILGLMITGSNAYAMLINGDFQAPDLSLSGWTVIGDAFEAGPFPFSIANDPIFPQSDRQGVINALAEFGDYAVLDDIGSGGFATVIVPNQDTAGIEQAFLLDPSPAKIHVGFDYIFAGFDFSILARDLFTSSLFFDRGAQADFVINPVRVGSPNLRTFANIVHFDAYYNVPALVQTDPNALIRFELTERAIASLFDPQQRDLIDTWVVLDNIVVERVPEPGTMLLLGSGLAGLVLMRRRFAKG